MTRFIAFTALVSGCIIWLWLTATFGIVGLATGMALMLIAKPAIQDLL